MGSIGGYICRVYIEIVEVIDILVGSKDSPDRFRASMLDRGSYNLLLYTLYTLLQ